MLVETRVTGQEMFVEIERLISRREHIQTRWSTIILLLITWKLSWL